MIRITHEDISKLQPPAFRLIGRGAKPEEPGRAFIVMSVSGRFELTFRAKASGSLVMSRSLIIKTGARGGTRTPTGIPLDPKSSASTSSATLA